MQQNNNEIIESILLGSADEIGYPDDYLLSQIDSEWDYDTRYLDWQDAIPKNIYTRWKNLSKEARLVAVCVALNSI